MNDELRAPDDSDVEAIEWEVGMGAGAWDMVNPRQIIAAAWKRLLDRSRSPLPENPNPPQSND